MNKNQTIKCNVSSCMYNNETSELCNLQQIWVCACKNGNTGKAEDESKCDSNKSKY